MDKIAKAPDNERKKLFIEVADRTDIEDFIIEKDFWVSWILGKIFSDNGLSELLCFKGGTSLSKAFGLIDRFSEDIDLILAQKAILQKDEALEKNSKSKQEKFNDEIEARAEKYISTKLKDKISAVLGNVCKVEADKNDGHILLITFPRVFDYTYIQPEIKLEVGPLALWNPNEKHQITSFVSDSLPELKLENPLVPTIKPERTFWEKITILHHEHYRPESNPLQSRYSRHYYDIFKMGHSKVKNDALTNSKLLEEVVAFKRRFYPRGWAKYDEAVPGTIRLYPAEHNLAALAQDYTRMQNMIFKNTPKWEEILEYLKELENEINGEVK